MRGTNPPYRKGSTLTSDNQCPKGFALTSNHVGTNPTITSEWPLVPDRDFLVTEQVPPFQEWHSTLISDHVGTNPTVISKWPPILD